MSPFDLRGFPARWDCGAAWSEQPWLGWLHIVADLVTFGAYYAVPVVVMYFVGRRPNLKFPPIFYVFLAGIFLTCGTGHLVESLIFWWPVYRFAGWLKALTAVVSCLGVVLLGRVLPAALELKRPAELQREAAARKQAQTALQEEQFLLQMLLEQLPDAIYFKDTEGRFLRVSGALAKRLGCADPSAVLGHTDADFFPVEYAELARADERDLMRQGRSIVNREEHPQWPDGSTSWVSTSKCSLVSPAGRVLGTLGISHDVTELKQQQEALQASEERYALAVQGSSDGLWDWNTRTDDVYYSPRFKQLIGYEEGDFPHRLQSFGSHLHPDDYERTFAAVRAHLEQRAPYDVTYRLRTKSGAFRWFRARGQALWNREGQATRMAGSITDITEQHQAEARFRQAVEASPSGMLIVDREGGIVLANSQVGQLFGYAEHELLGSSVDRLVPDRVRADHPRLRAGFFENPRVRLMGSGRDLTARRKDGSEFDIEIGLSPLQTDDGLVVLCSVIDITERRQNLRALRTAKDAAEAANRAKSEFLANISHEIRTPMNAVIGMTELVLDTELTPTQRDYLSTVVDSADALMTIINEILDFSKIEAGQIGLESLPFSLRETLGDALKTLAIRANAKELELAWQVAADVPDGFRGDSTRLRQIIVNLVGNAIKFTNQGEVVVSVDWGDDAQHRELHFTVRDTGIGIPAERQQAVFEPFTQADMSTTRQFGGTGLGLSISATLVKLMRGRIWLESAVGQGSLFHFTVCLEPATSAELAELGRANEPPDLRGVRVLVVDDNATNRRILSEMLTGWGINVQAVADAGGALEWLQQEQLAHRKVSLVITDLHMPTRDGFQLIESIRQTPALADTPTILLTSGHHPSDNARCDQLGLAAHLTKPVKQSELLKAILQAVSKTPAVPAASGSAEKVFSAPALPRLRILLAEDGLTNQKLAVGLLSRWGHAVSVAQNGREAVAKFASEAFDVVLMDVNMPELDGLQATREIRQREIATGKHIPIIAMTAHALVGDRQKCLIAGMDGYISKPVRQQELAAALAEFFPVRPPDVASAGPASSTKQLVDWERALKQVDQDAELLRSVIETAVVELPDLLRQLTVALDQGDRAGAQRSVHTLKASGRTFAITALLALAERMEQLAAAGNLSAVRECVPELRGLVERVLRELTFDSGSQLGAGTSNRPPT